MGAKSSVRDVLKFLSALVSAYAYQKEHEIDFSPNNPFCQLRNILKPHLSILGEGPSSYCLGTYRTELPSVLSCASLNASLLGSNILVFWTNSPGVEVFHHITNMPGYLSSYFLMPETQSGVVCFTNSTPLFCLTNFTAQVSLAMLLGDEMPGSLPALGRLAAEMQIARYKMVKKYIERKRTLVHPSLPFSLYTGK